MLNVEAEVESWEEGQGTMQFSSIGFSLFFCFLPPYFENFLKVKTGQNKIWAPHPDLLKHEKLWPSMQLALTQPLPDVSLSAPVLLALCQQQCGLA